MMMMFLLSPSEIMHRTLLSAVYHLSISLAGVTFNFSDSN